MKEQIIKETLINLKLIEGLNIKNFAHFNAFKLLIGTIAQESAFKYRKQLFNGPAVSYFQIEPFTALDIIKNYINYREPLKAILLKISNVNQKSTIKEVEKELYDNFLFACFIARIVYYRSNFNKIGFKSLYEIEKPEEMAKVWKIIYNTKEGKGKESEFIKNYKKYKLDEYDLKYYNEIN